MLLLAYLRQKKPQLPLRSCHKKIGRVKEKDIQCSLFVFCTGIDTQPHMNIQTYKKVKLEKEKERVCVYVCVHNECTKRTEEDIGYHIFSIMFHLLL